MVKRRIVSRSTHVDPDKVGRRKATGTTEVYLGTVEAQWTCTSCGRTGIPGRQKRCPSCGNPKDASEEYEAPTTPGRYLTRKELQAMGVDPKLHLSDEECAYCGAKLKPGTQKCPNCGAPLSDVGYTTRKCPACERESNAKICPNCGTQTKRKLVAHHHSESLPVRSAAPKFRPSSIDKMKDKDHRKSKSSFRKRSKWLITAGQGLVFLCVISCLLVFLLFPRNEVGTVTDVAWERKILIQAYQYNRYEGWDPPAGADIGSRERRIHHHDKVQDGVEEECGYETRCESYSVYDHTETVCYDDGTCDKKDVYRTEQKCRDERVCEEVPVYESVPVYETWYVYHVWEWVDLAPAIARGYDTDLYWPEIQLGENQRERDRKETCSVEFTNDKGKTYWYQPSCSELAQYLIGSKWKIRRNAYLVTNAQPLR